MERLMAGETKPPKRRIRKTAPTIRELSSSANQQSKKRRRVRSWLSTIVFWPFRKLKKSNNFFVRSLRRLLRPFGKVLRWLTPGYFINSWRELKLVTWPGRRETWRLTLAVFVFAIIFGVSIYFVDKGLDRIFKELVIG